jgi:adenylate kinase
MNTRNDRATWLKGSTAKCSLPPKPRSSPPRLVLLGSPGAGKGTQTDYLCAGLGVCHLSTGDVFRAAKCFPDGDQTRAMTIALTHMQHGEPVSDELVLDLMKERMACLRCQGGFLLDGFPRTVLQAVALDNLLEQEHVRLDAALNYTLPFRATIARLSGRRTCGECKAVFHVTERPPLVADVCDYCGGILVQREDDRPEAIEQRMIAYEQSAKPLIDYYLGHGILRTISADGTPARVFQRTLAILDN